MHTCIMLLMSALQTVKPLGPMLKPCGLQAPARPLALPARRCCCVPKRLPWKADTTGCRARARALVWPGVMLELACTVGDDARTCAIVVRCWWYQGTGCHKSAARCKQTNWVRGGVLGLMNQ